MRRALLLAALVSLSAPVPAQVLRTERRTYARLEALRNELLAACLVADADVRASVAELLGGDDGGEPYRLLGRAIARARGVVADAAAEFRSSLVLLALPEVVDLGRFDSVHVTLHVPRGVPQLDGARVFDVAVVDAAGEVVRSARIDDDTGDDDLKRFRATTAIPLDGLPDGRYRVRVHASLGGALPRPTDVALEATVHVLRSYAERALRLPIWVDGDAGRAEVVERILAGIPESRRDPRSLAILDGASWGVERSFHGEPGDPTSDAVAELELAERVLANLRADRDALDGVHGRVTIGVPAHEGDGGPDRKSFAMVSIDLPPADRSTVLPLLVFVPGAPSWDHLARRPMAPEARSPGLLVDQLARAGFDGAGRFHVAVLESPGRVSSAPTALASVTTHLRAILPVRGERALWIGEREGAFAVARAALDTPSMVAGIVLVAGAPLGRPDLAGLDGVEVLAIAGTGHPSTPALRNLARVAGPGPLRVIDAPDRPWPIAVGLSAPDIEAFARARFKLD